MFYKDPELFNLPFTNAVLNFGKTTRMGCLFGFKDIFLIEYSYRFRNSKHAGIFFIAEVKTYLQLKRKNRKHVGIGCAES